MSIIKKIKTTIKQEVSQLIRYRTELVLIDESELSELQDKAAAWNLCEVEEKLELVDLWEDVISSGWGCVSVLEMINDATEADGEVRDLKKELAFTKERLDKAVDYQGKLISDSVGYADKCEDLKQTIREMEDRAQELQGELDSWHSLGSGYGLNLDVSDVEEKLDILAEWEDLISRGMQPSEIEEIIDEADEWIELCSDTGMQACEIQQELDRLEELDADLEQAKNQLSSAKSKAIEIGMVWRSLEISLDC